MADSRRRYPRSLYLLVGSLTSAVLLYSVAEQIVDHNFQVLWEVTAILAGDVPYRDFYVTGWPLETALSAVVQWLVGYRLIGEFLVHWLFLLAAILLGFHLALRLSHSMAASLAMIPVTLLCLGSAATVHFPKLFFYPLAVLVAWRYIEAPAPRYAAIAGVVTATAFLFRHDHGVYVGVAFVAAFALARAAMSSPMTGRAMLRDASTYAAAAAAILAPWIVVVHAYEGFPDFVRTRMAWGAEWAPPPGSPFDVLDEINPLRVVQGIGAASWRPVGEQNLMWLVQVTLLLPMFVLVSVGLEMLAGRGRDRRMATDRCATILLAGTSLFVMSRLGREESYYVAVLPLSTALGARLLAGRSMAATRLPEWAAQAWRITRQTMVVALLLITGFAAVGALNADLFSANELEEVTYTYRQLLSSPPVDAYQPADEALEMDWTGWHASGADTRQKIMIRYMHDCTTESDRILVTGSTPYHVGYYVERPLAGGQMQWHHRWRSDPPYEQQALALIRRQSVPFAFSTTDPVFDDFRAYPRIHAYLTENYVEIEGSRGRLLVDKRRQSTGRFGRLGWPCFR